MYPREYCRERTLVCESEEAACGRIDHGGDEYDERYGHSKAYRINGPCHTGIRGNLRKYRAVAVYIPELQNLRVGGQDVQHTDNQHNTQQRPGNGAVRVPGLGAKGCHALETRVCAHCSVSMRQP
ncbi:Uncharacterised protein [Mycobacteroides abscessus subsp. abscessus]|nr:Uncharacterised protein [Mycobacteroides abscessus subsp. abscessus]